MTYEIRVNKSQLDSLQAKNSDNPVLGLTFRLTWRASVDSHGKALPGFMTATFFNKSNANDAYELVRNACTGVTRNWVNEHPTEEKKQTGMLTSEEAFERAKVTKTLIVQSFRTRQAFFFSDSHCFSYKGIDKTCLVPTTLVFPTYVVPRDGLEDGIVDTVEKYIFVFIQNMKQLSTIEEILDYSKLEEDVNAQFAEPVFAMGETYESYITDEELSKGEANDIVFDIAGSVVTFKELNEDVEAALKKFHYHSFAFSSATVQALLEYIKKQHEKPTN